MKLKLLASLCAFLSISNSYAGDGNLGTRSNPLKIAIVPSGQAAKALSNANVIAKCIYDKQKIDVKIQIPNSYIAVVEAIGTKKVDMAFGDIVSFLIAKNKFGVEPFLQIIRYGTHSYQSAIFVKTNSPIKTVNDLSGKKFAYSDASSASSYIFPAILMKKNKKKFSQEVPTGSMDASIIALMQGQVDAAAAYYNGPDEKTGKINDARSRVENIYPNISKETRILWLSKPIPNEPVYIRKGLPKELKAKLAIAVSACIKEFPNYINNMQELTIIQDDSKVYDDFINEVENSGLDISNIFHKK